MKSNEKSYEESQKYDNKTKFLYIGGEPSTSGNIADWQNTMINNSMPIKINLGMNTDLFLGVLGPTETEEAKR